MGVFAISIYRDSTKVRIASIVLFSITTLKLFFIDLWHLGQLYRVAACVGLAILLILVSFFYQKFVTKKK